MAASQAPLLDEEGDLSPRLQSVLSIIFNRFSSHPRPRPSPHPTPSQSPAHPDAVFTPADLDDWAIATNGKPLPDSSKDEIRDFLDCDEEDRLTLTGFLSMYHLQSDNDPQETWKDLRAHGFDDHLRPLSSGPAPPVLPDAAPTRSYILTPSLSTLIDALQDYATATDSGGDEAEAASQLSDELVALQSIYGEEAVAIVPVGQAAAGAGKGKGRAQGSQETWQWKPKTDRLRLEIKTSLDAEATSDPPDAPVVRLSITLPARYPRCAAAPQLQLLDRYIGAMSVDHALFGAVLKAFWHDAGAATATGAGTGTGAGAGEQASAEEEGLVWKEGEVVMFEAVEWVKERVGRRLRKVREEKKRGNEDRSHGATANLDHEEQQGEEGQSSVEAQAKRLETTRLAEEREMSDKEREKWKGRIVSSEPITERKSTFVGHAARIEGPEDVAAITQYLLTSDKRLAKAHHPLIAAWQVRDPKTGAVMRDNDDDGETAAGGRLAHLLELCRAEDCWVGVTRWYGGVQLGATRFKLINQAARHALEKAGIVRTGSHAADR